MSLPTLVERYLGFVYSSALRRTGDAAQAAEVTRAVFVVLARPAHTLRRNTILAGWLFQGTGIVCRKLQAKRIIGLAGLAAWIGRRRRLQLKPEAKLWSRLAPEIDRALERLSTKQRNGVLLCVFLNHDYGSAAKVLGTTEQRVKKREARGIKKLANRFGLVDRRALALACSAEGCAAAVPDGLAFEILQMVEESRGQRPTHRLAHRTLMSLAWLRWRRRFLVGVSTAAVFLAIAAGIGLYIDSHSGYSRLISERALWWARIDAW